MTAGACVSSMMHCNIKSHAWNFCCKGSIADQAQRKAYTSLAHRDLLVDSNRDKRVRRYGHRDPGKAESAHLEAEANVGVGDTSDCFHSLKDFSVRFCQLPHQIGYDKSHASGNALDAVHQDIPIASPCSLQQDEIFKPYWRSTTYHCAGVHRQPCSDAPDYGGPNDLSSRD